MSERLRLTAETLQRLIRRNTRMHAQNLMHKFHPADLAHMFIFLHRDERRIAFSWIPDLTTRADLLAELEPEYQGELLETMGTEEISEVVKELPADDGVELLSLLGEEVSAKVLELMDDKDSEDVEELLSHGEETAGRIMVTDYLALDQSVSVGEAIARLQTARDAEMVFYIYVTDADDRLVGVISLRKLLLVAPDTPIHEIMVRDVITIQPHVDQEEVAKLVARYNLLALPVVDHNSVLLGIVTVDDVIDVIKDEATEDLYRMAGTHQDSVTIDSPWQTARSRFSWLLARWIGGLLGLLMINLFTELGSTVWHTVAFLPLLLGVGSTAAIQASTVTKRGLDTGVIDRTLIHRILIREIMTGAILALVYSILLLGVILLFGQSWNFALIVSISLILTLITSSFLGTIIPLVLEQMRLDPTLATMPLVSAILDLCTVTIFLLLLRLL